MKLDYYLIYTNITQNVIEDSIKNLSIRTDVIKFLEENIRNKFLDVSLGNNFFNFTPKQKKTCGTTSGYAAEKPNETAINWVRENIHK